MSYALCIRRNGKETTRGCLSYNGSFMFSVVTALEQADVIDREASPMWEATWPPKRPRLSKERAELLLMYAQTGETVTPAPSPDERAAIATYRRERERSQVGKPGRRGRVPRYKFASNDGWIVTPKEAQKLADGVTKFLADEDGFELFCDACDWTKEQGKVFRRNLMKLHKFCLRAAAADGFAVY